MEYNPDVIKEYDHDDYQLLELPCVSWGTRSSVKSQHWLEIRVINSIELQIWLIND